MLHQFKYHHEINKMLSHIRAVDQYVVIENKDKLPQLVSENIIHLALKNG